jgi:hypothetical protein
MPQYSPLTPLNPSNSSKTILYYTLVFQFRISQKQECNLGSNFENCFGKKTLLKVEPKRVMQKNPSFCSSIFFYLILLILLYTTKNSKKILNFFKNKTKTKATKLQPTE